MRNAEVLEQADEVVAWWDDTSRGTVHTLRLAMEAGVPVTVFGPRTERLEREPWCDEEG